MRNRINLALTLAACAAATPAWGANILTNGGFEAGDVAADTWGQATASLTGWTITDVVTGAESNISHFDGTFFGANLLNSVSPGTNSAFEGTQYLSFNSFQGDGSGVVSQDLATAIGQEYTVEFSIAHAFPGGPHSVVVDAGGINSLTQGATLGEWSTHSFNFVATGTTTTLSISDNLGAGVTTDSDLLVDAVSVNAVPEPGSVALGLVAFGVAFLRRRR